MVGNMTVLIVLSECNFYIVLHFVDYSRHIMATFYDNDSLRFAHETLLCP